mgnify:CR=1 FL=1
MANTRITQGVIKPNEDYDVRHINATGIVTAASVDVTNNLSVGGVLTYEDVTNVDSIGVITARSGVDVDDFISVGSNIHLGNAGVITATSFSGSGANLTGIDATALKDSGGAVKIQAQASGAMHTGFSTMQNLRVTGVATFGSGSTTIDNNVVNVGTALTLGHTQGLQFHTQNLHSAGFEINQINASGIITASEFRGSGANLSNLPAGLGTALSQNQSSPLNKFYYTNTTLGVDSTITVDHPASASAAYTQYGEIKVSDSADLIIAEGDDVIPDVLGLAEFGTIGGGASAGRMRVNTITNAAANGAPTVSNGLIISGVTTTSEIFVGNNIKLDPISGIITATKFVGDGSGLTGSVTINNNANNRIITGNTGTTLDAESTLTYDGNTLKFGGGSAPSNTTYYNDIVIDNSDTASGAAGGGGIKIYSGNQSWGGLIFGDSDSDQVGFIKYNHADNHLILAANGTNYQMITNAGIVSCINTTTGFLPPKGTTAQRTGIGVTPTGMVRYNTTTNNLELYKTTDSTNEWVSITARSSNFNMNYLVIGGGGAGGGNYRAGGGGAGAYRTNWNSESQGGGESSAASKPVTIGTAYSIVVGAGGGGNSGASGSAGGQSKFDNITADGGTGGARYTSAAPTNSGNGSGGGGGGHTGTTQPGGAAGTYGYAGGGGSSGAQCGGGGGGAAGAGVVGGSGGTNGDGGSALASTITGSSVLRAGGGGGGAYGTGNNFPIGGGGGAADGGHGYQVGKAATANTGSGGGGAPGADTQTGGAGGSGIVVLRFSSDYTATFTAGVTKTEATIGNEKVVTITATSDSSQTVTFA